MMTAIPFDTLTGARTIARGLRFPEGPVALNDGSIAFVEVERGTVSRVMPGGEVATVADVGGGPNGMAVGPDSAFYVCNNGGLLWREDGQRLHVARGTPPSYVSGAIQRVDPDTGEWCQLYDRCGDVMLRAPNDIVFDAQGGFYFTDFGKMRSRDRDIGCVYYALPDGSHIVEVIHPIMAPNGLGLSPDGRALYVAETDTARIWAFEIISPGMVAHDNASLSPHGGRLVCSLPGYQRLDSLAIQANGDICVATLVTGTIAVVSPHTGLLRQQTFPDRDTTNLCFGGSGLRVAYVTQSGDGLLLAVDWPSPGLSLNFNR